MNLKSAQTAKVGKIFKDARLLKSLSLSEASTETVINVEYIIAIESGDYSVFPARTYAIKYFEKYANFLCISPRFFDIYNANVVAKAEQEEKLSNPQESFFEQNKLFILLLVLFTLTSIIFLINPMNTIDEDIEQTDINSKLIAPFEFSVDSKESINLEIEELNDQINSFLNTDKLDSNNVNVNVDLKEPDV
tara:strand:- start:275 stop:850 length:576 start_codon:yes stop_codon:yes gene_type:complete